ncbi:MAG TPA: hybrid sensor histidine kinase/response regulator [Kofleriaceae bacterium]
MSGQRVLVVDDNAENRALAEATLEDDGYEVLLAKNGHEGIEKFVAERPDCLLLDIQMPGEDGVSVCEKIRALPGGEAVAIVFVTAQRDVAIFDRALAAGGDDFLTKPFRPSELVVRVQSSLRVRRLAGERSELYAEVKRQRDDLQRLQLQKEQLTAFLVHDLKNPAASIELQAERILRDPNANERGRSAATAIRTESRALIRMILDLLDLSRSDEGRLVPARTIIELPAFVAQVLEEHRVGAADSGITLELVPGGPDTVVADPSLLQRVLANLVDNAIRHAPDNSHVTITLRSVGDALEIRVADQGIGIPDTKRTDVFDRFESGGGTRNRGLGLAFCKVAVEAHGGSITIEDAAPGAVFCVRLPHQAT